VRPALLYLKVLVLKVFYEQINYYYYSTTTTTTTITTTTTTTTTTHRTQGPIDAKIASTFS